eukprot:scaffold14825_cov123-Isochrysis_galbana.AAC.1
MKLAPGSLPVTSGRIYYNEVKGWFRAWVATAQPPRCLPECWPSNQHLLIFWWPYSPASFSPSAGHVRKSTSPPNVTTAFTLPNLWLVRVAIVICVQVGAPEPAPLNLVQRLVRLAFAFAVSVFVRLIGLFGTRRGRAFFLGPRGSPLPSP